MTPIDTVHQRRVAAVTYAVNGGNVAETARVFGVSRKTIHAWKKLAETYGMEALRPKDRRPPQMPSQPPGKSQQIGRQRSGPTCRRHDASSSRAIPVPWMN